MLRILKRLVSIIIILSILLLNMTINFNTLFDCNLENRPLFNFGAQEVLAATKNYYYKKYTSIKQYVDNSPWEYVGQERLSQGVNSYMFNTNSGRYEMTYADTQQSGPSYASPPNTYYNVSDYTLIDRGYIIYPYSPAHYSYICDAQTLIKVYTDSNGIYKKYIKRSRNNSQIDAKGTYISTIIAVEGEYPVNGKHTDGFWYVIDTFYTYTPNIGTTVPSFNSMFTEADTNFIPQISVSDADNDTLTCKYYINSESTPRDTKTVTSTNIAQTVNFATLNMNSLTNIDNTIKFEVSDGKSNPVVTTVNFKVDKTPPTVGTVTLSSGTNNITVTGSATDNIAGLSATPYKYKIGTYESAWTSNTTYTQNSLIPNMQYNIIFTARDAKNHEAMNQQSIYTKAQIPTLVVNNPSSYTLDVTSTDQNTATTKYLVSVSNGAKYVSQEGNLTASPTWITLNNKKITINGLSPSTTYTFKAKAKNEVGIETSESSPISGTTLVAPPVSPTNITAKATNNSITLAWDPISGATRYDVEVNGVTIKNNGTYTAYTHTNLGASTQFSFRVRAANAGGNGTWSATITQSTLSNAPPAPLNVNAAANNTSIIITWDPSPGATTYQIKVDGLNVNIGSSTNYVHAGLTPGTQHAYQVRSISTGGESTWSNEMRVTSLSDAPVIPSNIRAVPEKTKIILSWDGIVGETYEIEVDGITRNIGSTPSYTHNSLIPDTQHTYRVRSNRGGVLSDWSTIVTFSTSADVFGVPYNFNANASENMVELTWDAVTDATGYELDVDGAIIESDTVTGCIHMGLVPGSQHVYKIRALKVDQSSDWSSPISTTTFLLSTPQDFSATTSQTAITLNWTAVEGATGYDIEMDGIVTENATNTSHTYNGLEVGSQHIFRIRARNQDGFSAWSFKIKKSTQLSSFEKPILSAVSKKNSIILMWNEIDNLTSYDVEVDGIIIQNIVNRFYTHSGLTPGAIHVYRVKARSLEIHDWSDELSVKTLSESPDTPSNIEASANINRIQITWDSVANATEYEIDVDGQIINVGNGTDYLHSSLIPDTQHTYKIRAINPMESSAWSTPITLKTKKSTIAYAFDCMQDETFSFIFTASDLQNPSLYTFTVTYDAANLDVVDLCASTARIDNTAGNVIGADVRIVQHSPGTIVFRKNSTGVAGQNWSGTVNSVKFKSKITGQPTIQYTVN